MLQLIQIKINGQISILFGPSGPSLNIEVSNPLIPVDIASALTATIEEMQTNGISSIHMEKDDYRIFTHTVKGGSVEHQDNITNPLFANIMNRQNELINIFNSQVCYVLPIEPTVPTEPEPTVPTEPIPGDIPPE